MFETAFLKRAGPVRKPGSLSWEKPITASASWK